MCRVFDRKKTGVKTLELNVKYLNEIANKYGYVVEFINGVLRIYHTEPNFFKTGVVVKADYNDNCEYVVDRFAVEFAGFGSCDEDKEDFIYRSLVKAKTCVDDLNFYLDHNFLV